MHYPLLSCTLPLTHPITAHNHHVAYNTELPFPVAFPPQTMTNVLAEWLAGQGVKQAHIAGGFRLFRWSSISSVAISCFC
jgi:hypothetical protein